jgi:hypothetical protein
MSDFERKQLEAGDAQFEAFCEHLRNCDLDAERDQLIRDTLKRMPNATYEEIEELLLAAGG